MEVAVKALVAALGQLIRYAPQKPINPLGIFLFRVERNTSPCPVIVFPGDGILSIGSMQCQLVMVEDIFLDSALIRVNLRRSFRTVPQ
jgi:hypothetical protein